MCLTNKAIRNYIVHIKSNFVLANDYVLLFETSEFTALFLAFCVVCLTATQKLSWWESLSTDKDFCDKKSSITVAQKIYNIYVYHFMWGD